jgi:hypothetical protein
VNLPKGPYLDCAITNQVIFTEFQNLRGISAGFFDTQLALPPISWAITMSCLVEIQLLLYTFSFADGVVGICNPEAAALSSFIVSMVFSSILYLADEIAHPCSGKKFPRTILSLSFPHELFPRYTCKPHCNILPLS